MIDTSTSPELEPSTTVREQQTTGSAAHRDDPSDQGWAVADATVPARGTE